MGSLPAVLSVVIAVVLVATAVADLTHQPQIVATMQRLGMPDRFESVVGLVKLAAALGLVVGLVHARPRAQGGLTLVVAWCLVAYFVVALVFHVRARDSVKELAPAVAMGAASLVLALAA